jgi:hypothetical protein
MREKTPRHFRNLDAWNAAMEAALSCYGLARLLPTEERFELGAQMRRATDPMLAKHLRSALGSVGELQTHIELTLRLKYLTERDVRGATNHLTRTAQLLHGSLAVCAASRRYRAPERLGGPAGARFFTFRSAV